MRVHLRVHACWEGHWGCVGWRKDFGVGEPVIKHREPWHTKSGGGPACPGPPNPHWASTVPQSLQVTLSRKPPLPSGDTWPSAPGCLSRGEGPGDGVGVCVCLPPSWRLLEEWPWEEADEPGGPPLLSGLLPTNPCPTQPSSWFCLRASSLTSVTTISQLWPTPGCWALTRIRGLSKGLSGPEI